MVSPIRINNNSQKTLLVVPAIFLVIATVSVVLRFRIRYSKKQKILLDDWLCTAALFLCYACYANVVVCVVSGGLGKPIQTLQPDNILTVFKAFVSLSALWATTIAVVQLAILALYIRIFGVVRWHAYVCYTAMVVVFSWWAGTFVTTVTSCIPLERFWNPTIPGKCISIRNFCIANGLIHVFIDACILTFPLPIIWRLKTTRSNKVIISIACLLGVFATISGLLRLDCLIPILEYDESDFTESTWIGVLFQILENTSGVICSCAPMLSTYVSQVSNSNFATTLQRFISTGISRVSQGSGGSGNSRRSARSARSNRSREPENPTIGSWRINKIKKESTFGVTTYEGGSQEHLAENSRGLTDGLSSTSVDFEMDNLQSQDTKRSDWREIRR